VLLRSLFVLPRSVVDPVEQKFSQEPFVRLPWQSVHCGMLPNELVNQVDFNGFSRLGRID